MRQLGKAAGNILALLITLTLFFSCASTSRTVAPVTDTYVPNTTDVVSIPVPKKSTRTYFSSIKKSIVDLVETGSPDSIKQAVGMLHKTGADEYQENEKVLLSVCESLMTIVWPSIPVNWDVPEVTVSTPYLGAVDSARRGIYDSSTGNTDFLTLVLPSLVLITSESRSDYYAESNAALRAALEMREDSVLANYLMGVLKRRQNHSADALDYFLRAADLAPDCFEVQYALADAYRRTGDNEKSLSLGESLVALYPQNVKVLELCAETSFTLGYSAKAEQYVVRVLLIEPENASYVLLRARLLMDKGDFIKASSLLDLYSRTDHTSLNYLLLRARLQRDWNKNTTAAGATMEQALSLYPENREVLVFAAQLASSANMKIAGRTAVSLAKQILSMEPDNYDALVINMNELTKMGDWKGAYDISSTLVNKKDCPQEIIFTHVDICLALKRNEEANRIVTGLYAVSPTNESIQQLYIKVLVAYGRKAEGIQLIDRLLPNATARSKSSLLYERSFFGADEDAVLGDLRSSLTANPRNKDALYRLYEIYYAKKDWRKAQYYLKQVVALNPSDTNLLQLNEQLDKLLSK